ncbi:MAG: PEP-CTERM sorting domain-containing protein [Prochlorothrix sp.]|nr:PEP-CTERM sorting domain-containing protein [Prochlorothrix sp.]
MKTIATFLASSAVAALAMAAPAQAAMIGGDCGDSTIDAVTTGTYLGCSGAYEGNDSNDQENVMNALSTLGSNLGLASGTWGYDSDDKSDADGNGVFTSNPGGSSGTLSFDSPMYGIFAVALKASTYYSIFVFDGGTTGISSFDFTTDGVAINNDDGAGLSHATFYSYNAVPEPLTLLGTAAALGMGVVMRRRNEEA